MLVKHKQPVVALSLITEICFAGDPMLYTVLPIHRKEVGLTS